MSTRALKTVKETISEADLSDQNRSSQTMKQRKTNPNSPHSISRKHNSSGSMNSGNSSDDSRPRSGDYTDSKGQRRKHSPKVSLNLNSKSNPLNPQTALQDILPGGKANYISGSNSVKDSQGAEGLRSPIPPKSRSPTTKTDLDEEFRKKVKRMDYNTVYMMAQRTKGPQQYKYRKILQEMYEEQNK